MKPIILKQGQYSAAEISRLKKKASEVLDIYKSQLEELFEIENPNTLFDEDFHKRQKKFIKERLSQKSPGNWIYFPWNKQLVHVVTENEYNDLRTNRNQNIITKQEQKLLRRATVGMVGLSIGNAMAVSMAYTGIANTLKLADFDILSTSNLNRIRSGLSFIGKRKIDITSQQIYEINPYANLKLFDKGLKKTDLDKFFSNPKPVVVFEAIDDFEMKIRVRIAAKKAKVPVVMLTNLGDSLLIDIERYDTEKKVKIFNGLIGDIGEQILKKPITEDDKKKYAIGIVGKDNIPERVFKSVLEVNKTLVGRPQLMSTVAVGGGIAAMIARKIILGEKIKSGRTRIVFDNFLKK